MSIVIDQVEGVVQKQPEPQAAIRPVPSPSPQPPGELADELQRRAQRLVHRLHAD